MLAAGAVERREIQRVGGEKALPVDVRIVVDNARGRILPGAYADVELQVEMTQRVGLFLSEENNVSPCFFPEGIPQGTAFSGKIIVIAGKK